MSSKGAIIRFCAATICVTLILTYISYKGLSFSNNSTNTMQLEIPIFWNDALEYKIPTEQIKVDLAQPKEESTISNQTITVGASGAVQGGVVEKFLSPYTADTSYNNVYLKNTTPLKIDLKEFVNGNININLEKNNQPQVLIMHTHATESYLLHNENYYTENDKSRTTDNAYNMVALGKIICDRLNAQGIVTIHDTTQHDNPSYNESYSRAANTIKNYLKQYPSIKIVIDLHRDAIAENDTDKVKLTTEIDGKKAAQIMLVSGSQSGVVTTFPNWKENLKLAVKLQQTLESTYPTLARSIRLVSKHYNQNLTTGSLLIEIGTDGNTFEEAKYSTELLSNALISLFNTL